MNTRTRHIKLLWLVATALFWPMAGTAQVPVDEDGNPIGQIEAGTVTAAEDLPVLSATELEDLVGPIALYPDDLLAVILPASTYPLQIVQAARFLEALEDDSSLVPNEDWDDSVVALTNYPEVVAMMSDDLDWTWRLGEAVVAQQTDVIKAIEAFRDRAYAAGNLKSDDFQEVTEEGGTIRITPAEEDVIYVPYYEPESVVVYQPRPVYYYYPRPYPVYYYPYPVGYSFSYPYFWGVTTAFSIGWHSHYLHVWHHSYYGHPYYGRRYWDHWWYRRPDIHVHKHYYSRHNHYRRYDRYRYGDVWGPNTRRTVRSTDQRITRTRYYEGSRRDADARRQTRLDGGRDQVARSSGSVRPAATRTQRENRPPVTFRDRNGATTTRRNATSQRSSTTRPSVIGRTDTTRATPQRPSTRSGTQPRRTETRVQAPRREEASTNRRTVVRRAEPSTSVARPSRPSRSFAAPPRSRPTQSAAPGRSDSNYSRSSQSRQNFSRPSQPRPSYSRPTQSRQNYSRPTQSRQDYSRPSQSRQSNSRPSSSRPAQAQQNRSSDKSGSNRSSRSKTRSGDRRRR